MTIPKPPPGFTEEIPIPSAPPGLPAPPEGFTEEVDPTGQSYLGGLARTFVGQGMAMGWGDEAIARLRQLGGAEYEKALADERAKVKSFKEMNPKTAIAAELAGGFATPGLGVAGGIIKPAATLGKRILQSSALGSGVGAVAGAGHADEDRMGGAATGAGVGAALGAAIPPVASAVGGAVKAVQPAITPTLARWKADLDALRYRFGIHASADGGPPANPGADAAAEQIMANQLVRSGRSAADIRRLADETREAGHFYSNSYAQDATALADDPGFRRLAGSVARSSPEAGNAAQTFITARQTGQRPPGGALPAQSGIATREINARASPADDPAGQGERLRDAFKRALLIKDEDFHGHAANAHRQDQAILQAAKEEAQTLYGQAYNAGQNINISGALSPVIQAWKNRLLDEPEPVAREIARVLRLFETKNGVVTNLERFDKSKQFADGVIEKFFESPEGRNRYVGGVLTQVKNDLLNAVDGITANELGSKYQAARSAFGSRMEARKALELGRDAFKQDSDISVDAFRSLATPGEQKLFRLGLLSGYEKAAANMGPGRDKTQLFDRPNIEAILSEVIPRTETATGRARAGATFADRPERFGRYVGTEKRMIETRNEVLGNSKTAQRLADDQAYESMNQLSSAIERFKESGSALNVGIKAAEHLFNRLFGMRADTSASLARMLFTADPARRADILARIEARMGRSRLEHFSRLMQQYQAALTQGSTVSAAGAAGSGGAAP